MCENTRYSLTVAEERSGVMTLLRRDSRGSPWDAVGFSFKGNLERFPPPHVAEETAENSEKTKIHVNLIRFTLAGLRCSGYAIILAFWAAS